MQHPNTPRLPTPNPYVREVEHLWRPTPVVVDDATRLAYLERIPYAFGLDRQSEHAILTEKEKMGHEGRVRHILEEAAHLGLRIPEPIEIAERQDGDLQYAFDRRFWFVDGVGQPATGFSASPYARPELWRAWGTAKELARFHCAPTTIIVGEATRLFRDENWLSLWIKAFWANGIRIHVCGFGEVTQYTLPGLIAYVQALSGWLTRMRRDARESRKRRGQLSHTNPPYGLRFDRGAEDRSEVWTEPHRWNNIRAVIYQLGTGKCTNFLQAYQWMKAHLKESDGSPIRLCRSHLRKILVSEIPEGTYVSYHTHCIPRMLQDSLGLHRDLDLTPTGRRRYIKEIDPSGGVRFPIRYHEEDAPIDPAVLERARLAMSQKGRPASVHRCLSQEPSFPLLPQRLIRCAVCRSSVIEHPPRLSSERPSWIPFSREQDILLVHQIAEGISAEEIARGLEKIALQETGHEFSFNWQRVKNRQYRLGVGRRKTLAENLAIVESFWEDPFRSHWGVWRLHCCCVSNLVENEGLTWEAARAHPRVQHVRTRTGCASEVVWKLILDFCRQESTPPHLPDTPPIENVRGNLEQQVARQRSDVDALNAQYRAGAFGDPLSSNAIAEVKLLRDPILQEMHAAEERLGQLENDYLTQATRQRSIEEFRTFLRTVVDDPQRVLIQPEMTMGILTGFIREVTTHLEEGWVAVTTIFEGTPMARMVGSLEGTGETHGYLAQQNGDTARSGVNSLHKVAFPPMSQIHMRLEEIMWRVRQEAHQVTIQRGNSRESIHASSSAGSRGNSSLKANSCFFSKSGVE